MNVSSNPSSITNIAHGTHITADIETDSVIHISGKVEGDITTTSLLILEESGHITGMVVCEKAKISGKLIGELYVYDKIEVCSTANIDGFVFTKKLLVDEGSVLKGIIKAGSEVDVLNAKISGQKSTQKKNKSDLSEIVTIPGGIEPKETSATDDLSSQKPVNRFLHKLLIGIPKVESFSEQTEAIYNASEDFLQALDFNLEIFDEPSLDPFYQNLAFVRNSTEEQADISRDFKKGNKLLENAFLKKEPEEDATRLQRSAVILTNLIGKFDEVALLLGEVLIIKFQQNDVQTIAVEIATEMILEKLRLEPKLITDPEKLYSLI